MGAVAAVLTGCATIGGRAGLEAQAPQMAPMPPYYLRAQLDDPFSAIESATKRLSVLDESTRRLPKKSGAEDVWQRAIDRFAFAQCENFPEAEAWAQWFGERPDYVTRVMERARPWLYDIVNEIERRDLPGELALLPVVESAYDPFAYSHGRASGTWQFVVATAQSHGIEINDWYDGRRDVYASTRAALGYLDQLSQRFDGDWNLALAAYNGGQGRVGRAIASNQRANRPTDWRSLTLPRETKAYIPKLHGLSCLFSSAQDYGLTLPSWPHRPVVEKIALNGPTDVVVLSALLGLDVAELIALNPGLNRHITSPTGPHHLIVPVAMADQARKIVEDMAAAQLEYRSIQVGTGDTLSGLAQRHNTTVADLKAHNGLTSDRIRLGQTLEIPSKINPRQPAQYADRYQELALLQARLVPAKRFEHTVRPGESLWVIARRYQVTLADIQRWNRLGAKNLIQPGQKLTIIMEPDIGTTTSVATTPRRYTVRNGDSLWVISRRHEVPLSELMRQNNLHQNSVLRPGQTLILTQGGSGE